MCLNTVSSLGTRRGEPRESRGDRRFDPITVYCTALATPTDTLVYEAQCALLSCDV